MQINVFLGVIVFVIALYLGVPDIRTDLGTYIQSESFYLVFLGTLASTLISTSFKEFRGILRAFKRLIIRDHKLTPAHAIELLVNISEVAQSASKQALVDEVKDVNDPFLTRGLVMIGDGMERDFIEKTLDTAIAEVINRQDQLIRMMRTMGSYAPMFGMMGTVMGVILVLKNVTDIDNIVSGMSLALLTTLYGLIFSSVVFIPVSNKLQNMSDEEILTKEIIKQGILMVYDKEIPLKVDRYLQAFIDSKPTLNNGETT